MTLKRYSLSALLRNGVRRQRDWPPAWRLAEPKKSYDFVIIGGGGHGLATAYYLARVHGATNVALLERSWVGGGNTGRNTAIIRSNYLYPESAAVYDFALKLYEGLSRDLNYNIMLSQRGVLLPLFTRHDLDISRRAVQAMQLSGVEAELLSRDETLAFEPLLNRDPNARYAPIGGILQRRGGIARHDAIAWGYARSADALGVDIIQDCAVTGFDIRAGKLVGVRDVSRPHRLCPRRNRGRGTDNGAR